MHKSGHAWTRVGTILTVSMLLSTPALAVFSPMQNRFGVQSALQSIYGSTFTPSGYSVYTAAPIYVSGTITAARVDDSGLGGVLDLTTGSPGSTDDQTWSGGAFKATVVYKESAYTPQFGYDPGASGSFNQLLDGVVGQSVTVPGPGASTFAWALRVPDYTQQYLFWSRQDLNPGYGYAPYADHLVTYRMTGPDFATQTWLLFWEDSKYSSLVNIGGQWVPVPGDSDYNDLVVEICAIPEPASILMLATVGVGLLARPKRRLQRVSGD